MRHRNRRLATLAVAAVILSAAVALGLFAVRDAITYFHSPSQIVLDPPAVGERIRIGGLVLEDSIRSDVEGIGMSFSVTDRAETVDVVFAGIVPDLFREGQGVIAEGRFQADGVLQAETILAKHDERYMPPEVAEALRQAGVWQGDEADTPDQDGVSPVPQD